MNKVHRLAVVLLVIAMIISVISIMVRISIDNIGEEPKGEPISEPPMVQGTVQLIVQKPRGETNEGG